ANELIGLSSFRSPSSYVKEIDNRFIRFRKDSELRPFQSIAIENYKLTNQIVDLNTKEEVIRQWLLRELTQTYGYPLELITLEYPVQQFSKRGYVDIAVVIELNGKKIPYIFAEVKAFASGIDVGLEQLQSYIRSEQDVRYGIVTDGIDVMII